MGLRIGEGSFYRETDIEIYQNGNAYQHIRDNGISEDREYHLSANELAELLDFISSRLSKLPSQIGSFASDSDFGTIILREKNFIRSVSLEGGAWQGPKDQVKLFYESMEKILNVFASSHPVQLNYESE